MDTNKGLNDLLKWSIKASSDSNNRAQLATGQADSQSNTTQRPDVNDTSVPQAPEHSGLTQDALRALMGGPSDADLMKEAMTVILHPEATLDAKITAFDNFEQLIENLDNANNMIPIGLWQPLLSQLSNPEPEVRKMAAWCVGTAVQNNEKSQAELLKLNGIKQVCDLAVNDQDRLVRRKAVYALSSTVRNFQPGMDEAVKCLPKGIVGPDQVSASDMDVIDAMMEKLREA